jgi:protein involved in polysaccharide export with SLBB domain
METIPAMAANSPRRSAIQMIGHPTTRFAYALCAFFLLSTGTGAQAGRQNPVGGPELARHNLSQVGASAEDIKVVLIKSPGLMVEIKRWVAQDATDQGQIITERDLADDAIFERLQDDVRFRSVVTQLLQRYGYLMPTVNPDSEAGKEQDLLVQERVKFIAQQEEQQRSQALQQAQDRYEKARKCSQGDSSSCEGVTQQGQQGQQGQLPQQLGPQQQQTVPGGPPWFGPNPGQSNPFVQPPAGRNNTLQQAQLMQTGQYSDDQLSPPLSDNLPGSLGSQGLGGGGGDMSSLMQQLQSENGGGAPGSSLGGSGLSGSLLNQYAGGGDLGGSFDRTDINPFDMTQFNMTQSAQMGAGMNASGYRNYYSNYYPPSSFRNPNQALLQPATMVRKPNPYNDIPSLYDMYMQATPRPATARRFGMDVFENNSQNPYAIPMDLPAGPDYVVGPGDGLAIDLWGGVSRRIYRSVDREGRISLPEVGPLLVSGKSLAEVQQSLQQVLRTQFRNISADVSLSRLRTVRIYVVGDVANPGAYDVSSLSTPLNALFIAGGPTPQGSLRIVRHLRGNELVQNVDLYDLLLHGVKSDIQRLQDGDSVLVPPIGPQVTVEGMVRRPAIYELKDEESLSSALELAGGLLPTATLRHIEVQRIVAHEKQTMLSLDIPASDDNAEATKKLDAFQIQDGDRIRVFPISQGDEDAVYLEGHVIRPGRYSYHDDMRVTDLIPSFKDLLPEPSTQYAEIIRLNAPDFRPSVQSFNLADAFANPAQAPVLHAMDTVRVFSRFDFENPPTVSVLGDVRMPGTYRTSGQIHLADAVHLAGGMEPDAQAADAQVFRYMPDGKAEIFSVALNQALAGDSTQNIVLQPRDRLLIHKSTNAVQPAVVYITGEVGSPGRYPLTTNMTVADLVRVGGGLKPDADSQDGDLTRYEYAGQSQLTGQHEPISIAAALSGDPKSNAQLHNGDVVSIRQLPGWEDLGATITLKGEVKHPGTYGIRPGERLSSVLERAGGFLPSAYPYGAVLERVQVRELETKEQNKLLLRVKDAQGGLQAMPETTPAQKQAKEMALGQYQTTLMQLTTNAPVGRIPIRISSRIDQWKNKSADIAARAGDTLVIPKRPDYVMVTGQVFNPTAVAYRSGKNVKWYLEQAGGVTTTANRKAIFVIRADGSIIGKSESLWGGSSLGSVLQAGDTVVVPEKAIGPGVQWANLFAAASVASSIVSTVFIATHY